MQNLMKQLQYQPTNDGYKKNAVEKRQNEFGGGHFVQTHSLIKF